MRSAIRPSPSTPALVAFALALLAAPSARAHDVWIVPSSHRPAAGERLEVRLFAGERFRGEAVPRRPERIERFEARRAGERRPILGLAGMEPAGVLKLDAPGTWLLVYDNLPAELELPADRFEHYLVEEGQERILELRRRRGESATPGRERYSRSVKALVTVSGPGDAGPASDATGFDHPVGLELELIPERDPRALAGATEIPFRLLFRGEPLPGARVTAFPETAPERAREATTDADGRVRLSIEPGDRWLVRALHLIPAAEPEIDWESFWSALTFESHPKDQKRESVQNTTP